MKGSFASPAAAMIALGLIVSPPARSAKPDSSSPAPGLSRVYASPAFLKLLYTHPMAFETALRVLGRQRTNLLESTRSLCGQLLHPSSDLQELYHRLQEPRLAEFASEWGLRLEKSVEAIEKAGLGDSPDAPLFLEMPLLEIELKRSSGTVAFVHPLPAQANARKIFEVGRPGSEKWAGEAQAFDDNIAPDTPLNLIARKLAFFARFVEQLDPQGANSVEDALEFYRQFHDIAANMSLLDPLFGEEISADERRRLELLAARLLAFPEPGTGDPEALRLAKPYEYGLLDLSLRRHRKSKASVVRILDSGY